MKTIHLVTINGTIYQITVKRIGPAIAPMFTATNNSGEPRNVRRAHPTAKSALDAEVAELRQMLS
jgi:uncharacterized protein (UPF0147 family)